MFIEGSLLADSLVTAIVFLTIASFIAGFIDAVAGGAGLVLVPSFMIAGMPPQLALGQEKLVSTIGTISAIRNFVKDKKVIWKLVPVGVVLGLLGAYVGARAILFIDEKLVAQIIVFMLPVGLLFTLFKGKFTAKKVGEMSENGATKHYLVAIALVSFIVGFYDGFFGPGTGSLFIIALYLFVKIDLVKASATSKIFNFASNIGAFVAFSLAGKMLFKLGIPMVMGSLAGNYIGSKLTILKGEKVVKTVLILTVNAMLVTLALKFIFA
ncbi:hypothetical protein AB835_13010 [Candidatus Endobugula sertula]|uniref:Probable membrane transporter protein n=1 Tax=Candidatus Endobugula sertula TaxID=62101 RepID=A0A1D2QM61_9GAMM|nr:hypothetical protein AB835_13010 [Candidatus Endobugula sertula]